MEFGVGDEGEVFECEIGAALRGVGAAFAAGVSGASFLFGEGMAGGEAIGRGGGAIAAGEVDEGGGV